jgi:seryl-tRNA synthetase
MTQNENSEVFNRIFNALEKLKDQTNAMANSVAVHDVKLAKIDSEEEFLFHELKEISDKLENIDKQLSDEIESVSGELLTVIERLKRELERNSERSSKETIEKIEKIEDRISTIENWKWIIIGTLGTIGYLIDHLDTLNKITPTK